MLKYALKMLVGDKIRYIGIILGLSFASFIISQQGAIFLGIIKRTFGVITDTSQANIWVMDPTVQYIDDVKPMKDTELYRVRGVEGVEWAVPFFKGTIPLRQKTGIYQTCNLFGIDDATFIGGPPIMLEGQVEDLRMQDSIIVNGIGAETKLASIREDELVPLRIGDVVELNDHRAVVVGICSVSRTFQSQPVIYTTYDRATVFIPLQRKRLSFVLAKSSPGQIPEEVCQRIYSFTGLAAYTSEGLKELTLKYYMKNTGVFINFGVAILLGFIIGIAISGQTFYNFTLDNIRYFGTFKAMGADNHVLVKMILLQALFVSLIGWGIGIGATALFGLALSGTELSFSLPIELYFGSAISILFICLVSAFFSIRVVLKTDPAIVFKG